MSLMDATVYDATFDKKRRTILIIVLCVAGLIGVTGSVQWHGTLRLSIGSKLATCFAAVEKPDQPQAYGIVLE